MPSRKTSELESLTNPAGPDILYIVDDVAGTPTGKQISIDTLFGNVPSNTSISARLDVTGNTALAIVTADTLTVSGETDLTGVTISSNGFVVSTKLTPANSSVSGITTGKWFYDENYLYIKVSNTVIKRVALASF